MYARLSTYQGAPIPPHADLAGSSRAAVRQVRAIPGFRGVYVLVDRDSGRTMTLTLWEDRASMYYGEIRADEIRAESAERAGQDVLAVERFEVGFSLLVP